MVYLTQYKKVLCILVEWFVQWFYRLQKGSDPRNRLVHNLQNKKRDTNKNLAVIKENEVYNQTQQRAVNWSKRQTQNRPTTNFLWRPGRCTEKGQLE